MNNRAHDGVKLVQENGGRRVVASQLKQDADLYVVLKYECEQTTLHRTSFSESPRHLETMVDADMLKNVVRHSVATALASMVCI